MDSLKELENVTGRGELDWTKQAFRKAANMLFDARRDMVSCGEPNKSRFLRRKTVLI